MKAETTTRLTPDLLALCHRAATWQHVLRACCFTILYLLGAGGAIYLAERLSTPWMLICCFPLYLLAAASLHGISLFTHEAVHGTLSKNRGINGILGAACAIPVLQNFSAYRVLHLRHHQHLGEDGDPDHYANYTRWTWLVFLMNWARLLIGYPAYIIAIPILGFKHGNARARAGIVAEIMATVLLIWMILVSSIPSSWIWHGWVIPMLIINTMVNIRGMSQHTLLEDCNDEVRGTRSILTSPVVRFFMCNENYHLEHHLYPGVPWHHLPKVHEALEPALRQQGAPYITSYHSFVAEFIRSSLKRSPLGWRKSK